jgi:hypothetical protein
MKNPKATQRARHVLPKKEIQLSELEIVLSQEISGKKIFKPKDHCSSQG